MASFFLEKFGMPKGICHFARPGELKHKLYLATKLGAFQGSARYLALFGESTVGQSTTFKLLAHVKKEPTKNMQ